jgi:uncharacterized membrane protein YhaH (DUF805 family)
METISKSAGNVKLSSRASSVLMLMLVIQAVFVLDSSLANREMWRFTFYLVLTPVVVVLWMLHSMRCLRDLRLSRLWVLAIAFPMSVVALSVHKKWLIVDGLALAVVLIVQLVIAIAKPKHQQANTSLNPNGPIT